MKKLLILIVILLVAAIVTIPMWTGKLAEKAFENIDNPNAPRAAKEAMKMKIRIGDHAAARSIAERGVIYFADDEENLPFFLYNAAHAAKKDKKPRIAVFWYEQFLREFPDHEWSDQAELDTQKLKELHGL